MGYQHPVGFSFRVALRWANTVRESLNARSDVTSVELLPAKHQSTLGHGYLNLIAYVAKPDDVSSLRALHEVFNRLADSTKGGVSLVHFPAVERRVFDAAFSPKPALSSVA